MLGDHGADTYGESVFMFKSITVLTNACSEMIHQPSKV